MSCFPPGDECVQSTAVKVITGAVLGALMGLGIGLVAIALAPTNGFGDLAAAAVTTVFLIPAGVVVGGVVAFWRHRRHQAG